MIDPFDAALSEFIDTLPADAELARQLLEENAPFTGRGDLPEFAELATRLRAVPPPQPRPEWVAASKARLMTAPLLPPEKRGFTWLGSMFLPFSHLSFPTLTLPRLTMPSPVFARAAMALVMILTLASVAHQRSGQNPIVPLTTDQAPEQDAQQAIAATQDQVARLGDGQQSQVAGVEVQGTVRDVVLLSQQIDLAELAIDKAPPAQQPQLRSQLQSAVRAVRFDGQLEAITNDGATLQVSGVAVQADPTLASKLQVGQPVSLLVRVNGNGKLQAVQASPAATPTPAPAATQPPSSPPAPPPPAAGGGTAPQTSSPNTSADAGASPASALPSPSPAVAVAPTTRKSVRRRDDDAGNGGAPAGAGSAANGNGQPGAGAAAGGNQPAANGAGATVNGVAATGSDGSSGSCAAGGIPGCGSNGNGGPGTGGATANGAAGNGQLGAVGGNGNSTPGNVQTGSGSQGAVSQAGQVSVGSSSSSSQVSSSVSVTSSGGSHSVSVSVSSSSSSSSQQSSGGSSSKGGGDHAQGGRMLAAARISLASSDNKGKGKADHKG